MSDQALIDQAAKGLAAGHLVAFPTETVYGLGADALSSSAVARIFSVKGRPADHPLIVHVADLNAAKALASGWPESAQRLAQAFWPGPLTLIVQKAECVPMAVTGGQQTVGLRVPSHPMALGLLRAFGQVGSGAVAAPSANRFGGVSPTRAQDVSRSLVGRLGPNDQILDGGACQVGLESSIVDCTVDPPRLLRPGGLPRAAIEAVLALAPPPASPLPSKGAPSTEAPQIHQTPRVSGSLDSHYAPSTRLLMLSRKALLESAAARAKSQPSSRAALCFCFDPTGVAASPSLIIQQAPTDAADYGRSLYARLNDWDQQGFDELWLETPPLTPEWEAVWDRLRRASHRDSSAAT
ncbi:MAG: L-threonylcarbamoyladenylate synthase [Burkholderiaceae bacterium]